MKKLFLEQFGDNLFLEMSNTNNVVSYTLYKTTNHESIILLKGSFELSSRSVCEGESPCTALSILQVPVVIDLFNHCVITSHKVSIVLDNPTDPISKAVNFLVEKIVSLYTDLITFDPEA